MNCTARFMKAFSALPLCLLLNVDPSHAVSVIFTPTTVTENRNILLSARQLDHDPLLDLNPPEIGGPFEIQVILDTTGATNPLTSIQYDLRWDPTEIAMGGGALSNVFASNTAQFIGYTGNERVSHSGTAVAPGSVVNLGIFGFAPNLDVSPNPLNNDGEMDIWLERVITNDLGTNVNVMPPIEVQPIPEPSEYVLMLAGLGVLGWIARRQRAT